MLEAAFWGAITAGSLLVGATIALAVRPSRRVVGLTMAFGAGALIAAVAFALVSEAFDIDAGTAAIGFAAGALAFYVGDRIVCARGGEDRKRMEPSSDLAGSARAIVLGTMLDGVPESFVLGASLQADAAVPFAVVVAVFVSNVPESLSATVGLRDSGWAVNPLLALWGSVVAVSIVFAALGWLALGEMGGSGGALALGFAGGALLVMLADTLMPEAFELGGPEAGLLTALGFGLGFSLAA